MEKMIDIAEYEKYPHDAQPDATRHQNIAIHRVGNVSVETRSTSPANLLQVAIERGASLEMVEKLMELQIKFEANEARKAYVDDMAKFKQNPPTIGKDKEVGYTNKDGTFTGYKHASIGNVTNAIVASLAEHGFAHRWDTDQIEGGQIVVTCIITHRLGHSEKTALQSSRDDSGKKNNIQQMASTITYLQRYTLLAATGLATHDQVDDDGAGSEKTKEFQVENFIAEMTKFTKDDLTLKYWNEHKAKFVGDNKDYADFKSACAKHRQFIKEAV